MTEKIQQSELQELFGELIPIEAVNAFFNAPDDMTIDEVRKQLASFAAPPDIRKLVNRLRIIVDDPMWADHVEMRKATLQHIISELMRVSKERDECLATKP